MQIKQKLSLFVIVLGLPAMAQAQDAFEQTRDTFALTCGILSSSQAIPEGLTGQLGQRPFRTVIVTNKGTEEIYWESGDSDVEARIPPTGSKPVLPDSQNIFRLPPKHTHIACITATSTSDAEFTAGTGF